MLSVVILTNHNNDNIPFCQNSGNSGQEKTTHLTFTKLPTINPVSSSNTDTK